MKPIYLTYCFLAVFLSGFCLTNTYAATTPLTTENTLSTTGVPLRCSPRLADIDGNANTLEIIIGDDQGYLTAFDSAGNKLWEHRHSLNTDPTPIIGSPAIGDIDNDGKLEIVVGLSDEVSPATKSGLIYALDLDANGNNPTEKWYIVPEDHLDVAGTGQPNGIADGCISSPALGDVDGDGIKEVMIGCWDTLVYAINGEASGEASGSIIWNQNPLTTGTSHKKGWLSGDTIWSSPAIADVDGDGKAEVFIGIDTHNEGGTVPSGLLPFQTASGGAIAVLEDNTAGYFLDMTFFNYLLANTTIYTTPLQYNNHVIKTNISEVIWSSPAIGDIDNDGKLEIVHGTGPFYNNAGSNRLYAWNLDDSTTVWGTDPRNFASAAACDTCGVDLGALTVSSPAIGDINGDGILDVAIFGNMVDKIFAVNGATGASLTGFPVTLSSAGQIASRSSPVIADVDGDGQNEILIVTFGTMHVVKGDGTVSQSKSFGNLLMSTPAVGDIDGDGMVEVIAVGNSVNVLQGGAVGTLPWPQFRHDPLGTGNYTTSTGPVQYQLTATMAGTGTGTVTASSGNLTLNGGVYTASYVSGTSVTLTATADTGSTFAGWTGGGCSGIGTCTVTISAAQSVTATFTLTPFQLAATMAGTGTGTVTASTGTLSWSGNTGTASYTSGTSVTLTATASTGSTFAGWTGGGCSGTGTCTVAMSSAQSVTATFTLLTYQLTVTKAGAGSGTVTAGTGTLSWSGNTGTATYDFGTSVTLTALAGRGFEFSNWSGEGCGGTGICTVTMTQDRNVTATFAIPIPTLSQWGQIFLGLLLLSVTFIVLRRSRVRVR